MADFNPYAKRKRGFIGQGWDFVSDHVSVPSAGSLVGAGTRIAGGQFAKVMQDVRRIALRKAALAEKLKFTAEGAAKKASAHAMRLAAPAVNRAADAVRTARAALSNQLAPLRSAVTAATENVRTARGFLDSIPDGSAVARAKKIALGRAKRKIMERSIMPLGRELSATPVRSAADLANRAARMSRAKAGMETALQRVAQQFPSRAAIAGAQADRAVATQMLTEAQAAQKTALNAMRSGGNRLRGALSSAEEALQTTGQRATEIAGRAANRARVAIMRRAPRTTWIQGATVATERAVKTAASTVKTALGGLARITGGALRQLVPAALKPAAKTAAAEAGKAVGKSLARKVIPRMLLAIPTAGGNLAVEGTAKGLAKGFNLLEKRAAKFAGKGAVRTLGGRVLVNMTRASSTAGGFALGALIDAGMKAYDFFSNGGDLFDVGKDGTETIMVHGRKVVLPRNNPGWGDIIFSKDYAKESLKGLQSALTLGFFGNGDDTVIDGWFDHESRPTGDYQNVNEQLVDVNGNSVYTREELDAQNRALATAKERSQKAQQFVKQARYTDEQAGSAGEQNLRTLMAQAIAERDAALQQIKVNTRNWGEFGKSKALRGKSEEDYVTSATTLANTEFDRKMKYIIVNPDAKKVMEANRDTAYALYYGRNYADDSKSTGLREQDDAAFRAFNREWAEASDTERLTWDKDAEAKRLREIEQTAYDEAMKEAS